MKRFVFRLESLLRYRGFQVDKALMELMSVQKLLVACEEDIRILKEEQDAELLLFEEESRKGISGERFRLHRDYLADMDLRLFKLEERKKRIIYQIKEKQRLLDAARVKKKALDNLKDRKKVEHFEELALQDQKETDDMVTIRKIREGML